MQKKSKNIFSWLVLMPCIMLSTTNVHAQEGLKWKPIEEALLIADSSNQPVFVNVWAPWCGWCRKMEQEVYPELKQQLDANFVLTSLNRDDNSKRHVYHSQEVTPLRLAKKFNVDMVPAIVILDAQGNYLLHITGFIEAEALKPVLEYISTNVYKSQSFETINGR